MPCVGGVAPCTGYEDDANITVLGEELALNGEFTDWATVNRPADFIQLGTLDANNYLEEDPSNVCHFVSDASQDLRIAQAYDLGIGSYTFNFQVTTYVSGDFQIGIWDVENSTVILAYELLGITGLQTFSRDFSLTTASNELQILLRRSDAPVVTDLHIDNWQLKEYLTIPAFPCMAAKPVTLPNIIASADVGSGPTSFFVVFSINNVYSRFILIGPDALGNRILQDNRKVYYTLYPTIVELGVNLILNELYTVYARNETEDEVGAWTAYHALFTGSGAPAIVDDHIFIIDGSTPDFIVDA